MAKKSGRTAMDKFLGTVPDNYSARPDSGWGKDIKPPTVREVRTGQRFSDGDARTVRNLNDGKYSSPIYSPREARRVINDLRAQGHNVIVEKVTDPAPATDGGTGCMVIFLVGGAAFIEALYQVGKAMLS